jgi:hypothetical protein
MSERYARGISCTWFGVAQRDCPFCHGAIVVLDNPADWWEPINRFESGDYGHFGKIPQQVGWRPRPHPGYRAMWDWAIAQQRCFKHPAHLKNSYRKHTGIDVDMTV